MIFDKNQNAAKHAFFDGNLHNYSENLYFRNSCGKRPIGLNYIFLFILVHLYKLYFN